MKRSGISIFLMIVYLSFFAATMLLTARLLSNMTKVAHVVERSEANATYEAVGLARLRDDCFAATRIVVLSPTWLQIDESSMWFIDDAGLRRRDAAGEMQLFAVSSTVSRFESAEGNVTLHLADRQIPLPRLKKGTP
jgi:hypothetical protein